MQENEIRELIEEVRQGALPRRAFIQRLVGVGLSAPMASMLLMHAGVAQAQAMPAYKPTKRGGGGTLKLIWWQGAVHLNPHFAGGTKEQDATRIFYEPLAGWDSEGNLIPTLAAEIPSRQNGGVSADGRNMNGVGKALAAAGFDAYDITSEFTESSYESRTIGGGRRNSHPGGGCPGNSSTPGRPGG